MRLPKQTDADNELATSGPNPTDNAIQCSLFCSYSKPWPTDSRVDASQRNFSTCAQIVFRLATHLRN